MANRYQVVKANTIEELDALIEPLVEANWECTGGVVLLSAAMPGVAPKYGQTMWKPQPYEMLSETEFLAEPKTP